MKRGSIIATSSLSRMTAALTSSSTSSFWLLAQQQQLRFCATSTNKAAEDEAKETPAATAQEDNANSNTEEEQQKQPEYKIPARPGWVVEKIPVSDRGYRKALQLMRRELKEEKTRPFLPPNPKIPKGWKVTHEELTSYFTMHKEWENDSGVMEHMRVFTKGEIKDPEKTYRLDDGERREPEHFNFSLFISKPMSDKTEGGIEFSLTSIDNELVLDLITMHTTKEKFDLAWNGLFDPFPAVESNQYYRGPYINELDDDLVDEFLNYLDERGINNAFAEFIMQQSHWNEQQAYNEWMRVMAHWASPLSGEIEVEKELPPPELPLPPMPPPPPPQGAEGQKPTEDGAAPSSSAGSSSTPEKKAGDEGEAKEGKDEGEQKKEAGGDDGKQAKEGGSEEGSKRPDTAAA